MQIRIQLITLIRDPAYYVDADPDPTFHFDADPDPQHWFSPKLKTYILSLTLAELELSKYRTSNCTKSHTRTKWDYYSES
jgi:hypothetical protein